MNSFNIQIRSAKPEDAKAVTAVIAASYEKLYAGWYSNDALAVALPVMTKANPELLASGCYYVVETNGTILGCGGWSREAPGGGRARPGTGHVRHVATHPDHLGKGVGRRLLRHVFTEAEATGMTRLECLSSLQAEAFYGKLGFRTLETVDTPFASVTLASVRMERYLP